MRSIALALPTLFIAQLASAQVLITELQPNPTGTDTAGEWIEIQNTGTTSVSIAGWTVNDYTGMNETATKWAFPMNASLDAGKVIVIALQSAGFHVNFPMAIVDYELAEGMDDPSVPNMVPDMGMNYFALTNNVSGDALLLRDEMGNLVNGMEYGTDRATVMGNPASGTIGEAQSWIRVNDSGSSITDFIPTDTPQPGQGFMAAAGPVLTGFEVRPIHVDYGRNMRFETAAMDADGVAEVDIYAAVTTSSIGNAAMNYTQITMTSTNGVYAYVARPGELDPVIAFADPATFHERWVRWFFYAQDTIGNASTQPVNADESAGNTSFVARNVMPTAPSPISDVVETDMSFKAKWAGFSAKVEGTVVAQQGVFSAMQLSFPIEDASDRGVRIFLRADPMGTFRVGDRVSAVGTVTQFNGAMELELTNQNGIEVIGSGAAVTTTTVTIAQLLTQAEELEHRLVYIRDARFVDPAPTAWPNRVQDGPMITDDSGMQIQVVMNADNELSGMPVPQFGFHIKGVLSQFASQGNFNDGYEVFPRNAADLEAKPMPPPPDAGIADTGGNNGNRDAGGNSGVDAGTGSGNTDEGGCNCNSTATPFEGFAGLFVLLTCVAILSRGKDR